MTSISLRKTRLPTSTTILWTAPNSAIPPTFSTNSSVTGKHAKNVSTGCTNPGTTGGATTHQHACSTHCHTISGSHTHAITVGSSGAYRRAVPGAPNITVASPNHSHVKLTCSANPSITIGSDGAHTHNAVSNQPLYLEYGHIKNNSSVSLRKKHIPFGGLVLWPLALAVAPPTLTKDTTGFCKIIKAIATGCTNPGTTGGCATHQHSCSGGHTHTVAVPSHTHTMTNGLPANPCAISGQHSGGDIAATCNHTHTFTFATTGATSKCTTTSNSGAHSHNAISLCPPYFTMMPFKQTDISIRKPGVASGVTIMWDGTLATIPTGYHLQDGTSGTVNSLDRFAKLPTTGCTNPGVTGGSATHTHSNVIHCHNANINHTHTSSSGTSGGAAGRCACGGGCGAPTDSVTGHTHTVCSPTVANAVGVTTTACHTHGSIDQRPPWIELAFIQKL